MRSTKAFRSSTITIRSRSSSRTASSPAWFSRRCSGDRRRCRGRPKLEPTGELVTIECDDVLMAIGQDNAFPWIERDIGLEFGEWDMPKVDKTTFMSTRPGVFFGGDAAWGPENIIWAVAHGHQAAISIDKFCRGEDLQPAARTRPHARQPEDGHPRVVLRQRLRRPAAHRHSACGPVGTSLKNLKMEVELGFDDKLAAKEVERCLNCDVQTVFTTKLCIECDACMDICPVDCINFIENAPRSRCCASSSGCRRTIRRRSSMSRARFRPDASWPRTRTCACIAACARSAVRPVRGTCRNTSTSRRRPRTHASPPQCYLS